MSLQTDIALKIIMYDRRNIKMNSASKESNARSTKLRVLEEIEKGLAKDRCRTVRSKVTFSTNPALILP
jgi:hypothetical protein